jgi:hypothetical protein
VSLNLRPVPTEATGEDSTAQADLRGVAIHWQVTDDKAWCVQRIAFHAVSASGSNDQPTDADEQLRYVLAANAIAVRYLTDLPTSPSKAVA